MPYLLTAMLESEDYKALQAYDGQEGIDLAVENHADAIILDLMMPEVNGFEVVRQLSAHPEVHMISIMIYTGKDLTRRIAGSSTVMSRPSAQNSRKKSSC